MREYIKKRRTSTHNTLKINKLPPPFKMPWPHPYIAFNYI